MSQDNESEELLKIFLEEARDLLDIISVTIQTWSADLNNKTCFADLKRDLHTLKGGARMVGLTQLSALAHELESLCEALIAGVAVVDRSAYELVCAGQDRMSVIIEALSKSETPPDTADIIAQFKQRISKPSLEKTPTAEAKATKEPEKAPTQKTEEVNEELLNIFLEEAKDLLDATSATIQTWSADLNNKTCFSDLKRDLHTLKGGARMVGLSQLSALAHELESLCEALIAGATAIDRSAYELVCAGQDRMSVIIEALMKHESPPDTVDIINQFKQRMGKSDTAADAKKVESQSKKDPETKPEVSKENSTAEEKKTAEKAKTEAASEVIRVRADLLEKLNNLSIESNIIRVNLGHYVDNFNTHLTESLRLTKTLQEKIRSLPREVDLRVNSEVLGLINTCKNLAQIQSNIESLLSQQSRIELELQDRLVDTRMVPFKSVVPRLSRITRQVATELKKKVDFAVVQAEGEIDRNLLEHLAPSLEHLLRNALDHGVESPAARLQSSKPEVGTINLRYFRMGNEACIEISDDGSGINPEAVRRKAVKIGLLSEDAILSDEDIIRYILEPGFSTREEVSEISGRGVGMDVVNTVVKGLGGNLSIESRLGNGTRFTIRLPFTTSVNRALLVVVQGQTFGILLSNIDSIVLLNAKQVKENLNKNTPVVQHNNKDYQLKYLGATLNLQDKPNLTNINKESLPALLFNFSDYNAALLVDSLAGSQEVVVQTLGPQFKLMDIFSGATLLADGRVVIILDAYSITSRAIKRVSDAIEIRGPVKKQPTVLVVDDSVTIRTVTKNFLERHKYTVITAKDGYDALEKLEQGNPDIILLDVEMPRMDGFQFAEKIRGDANTAQIPIIMITFCAGDEQRSHATRLGIDRFMSKPYQEPELLETIETLLEKR